jgi:hypothetical protein
MQTDIAPRVFISYAHEDQAHNDWVLSLANSLRRNGVDVSLDTWDLKGGQETTYFMESQIRDSDYVILVCTPLYAEKSNIPKGGVGYEKNIISASMLQASDLKPKFIPILKKGDFNTSLPTYLGSKYAIDFRRIEDYQGKLDELLRAIFQEPHPQKEPLGKSPFLKDNASKEEVTATFTTLTNIPSDFIISNWEQEMLGRFSFLRSQRFSEKKKDPFSEGYWIASFIINKFHAKLGLSDFLEILRAAETNRTGWDVWWVPTRKEIAPYPYKNGIEVWLAEDGGKDPGHSDFWRAEPSGKFVLIRGFREDDEDFKKNVQGKSLGISLILIRITEILLYIESLAQKMPLTKDNSIDIQLSLFGLDNRKLTRFPSNAYITEDHYISHQNDITLKCRIEDWHDIRKNLIQIILEISKPLFETFNFFPITEAAIKNLIKPVYDFEKEGHKEGQEIEQ